MFYCVGEYKDSSFIFDDSDSSCELISNYVLRRSHIDVSAGNSLMPSLSTKYLVAYNLLKNIDGVFYKSLVRYNTIAVDRDRNLHDIVICLDTAVVHLDGILNISGIKKVENMVKSYNYPSDYICCFGVSVLSNNKIGCVKKNIFEDLYKPIFEHDRGTGLKKRNGLFYDGVDMHSGGENIIIPLQMFCYIMNLYNMREFNRLVYAFGDLLTKGMIFSDTHLDLDSYAIISDLCLVADFKMTNIVWG